MKKCFHARFAAIVMLASLVSAMNSSDANAQGFKKKGKTMRAVNTAVNAFKSNGPDEPDFPSFVVRTHGGTLYIEGSQDDDGIHVAFGVVLFYVPNTMQIIQEVDIADVIGDAEVDNVVIYGLAGDDVISISTWGLPHTFFGGRGNDTLYGDDNPSALYGQSGNDTLFGYGGSDLCDGGAGADTLYGSYLIGGVRGADGAEDYLVGGNGPDTFALAAPGDVADQMLDFDKSEDSLE